MNRLIVPPLPAASRPSKRITCLAAGVLRPVLELQQLDLQQVLLLLVVVAVDPLVVRVVLAPGLDRVAARVDQVRVGAVLVVPHGVAVAQQVVEVLAEVLPDHAVAPGGSPAPTSDLTSLT